MFAGIVLTNDGHAILREIDVTHPAAKVGLGHPAFRPRRGPVSGQTAAGSSQKVHLATQRPAMCRNTHDGLEGGWQLVPRSVAAAGAAAAKPAATATTAEADS
jgi:hypothetical protein